MESRLIVAYSLLLLMVLAAAGLAAFRFYHSRQRAYRRRVRKEERTYAEARRQPPEQ